jgi:hypothetical protein
MAAKKKTPIKYLVEVTSNPNCCEVGAGGVHFAHGKAEITDARMAAWYKEHAGYKVTDIYEAETGEPEA